MERKYIETVQGFDIYEGKFGGFEVLDAAAMLDRYNNLESARAGARRYATMVELSTMDTSDITPVDR
jgi:hypothetical protein